jgi:transposase
MQDEAERCFDHLGTDEPPSVDPELMIRMLITGYCTGIRSVRCRIEEGVWIDSRKRD